MSERLGIDALKPGMVIVQITRQNGPVKIRKSGLVSSDAMVQGLAEMGVQEVEIDPEQTVEVASPVSHRTQTQALLRGQHDTSAKLDHTLSDQFNRSLFLPTVQSLPSVWKIYGKQALTFALVTVGGLCIGFTAATHSLWWPLTPADASPPVAVANSVDAGTRTATNETPDARQSDPQPAANAEGPEKAANLITQSAPEADKDTSNSGSGIATPDSQPSETATLSAASSTADTEGRVLNERQRSNVNVSPELMARFNKAVEAMDNEAQSKPEPETKITVHENMPRVDQLPVRVLTRLPTMSFSAHMYASQKDDRWVRVNGQQLVEGDWIDDRVQIVHIEAQHVVLAFEDELFTMAALTDW